MAFRKVSCDMRAGGEYFLEPAEAVQRRYEALRCYFVEDASAESVGARFGYSPAVGVQVIPWSGVPAFT
jgi:hypothetical protein